MDGRCFTGDTLVPTKHEYTAIKEIQKGDGILSRDEKTGRTGFKEAGDVFTRTVHTIYHVWLDGKEEIKTTAGYPVYVQGQGWVAAISLREGDTLETMDGTACITKIVKERHEEPVTVYNLAVKDWVSYFVGKVRVYVHNGAYKGGSKSKYLQELNNLSENKINYIINGSKNSNHRWEKLVPNKNWDDIKNIIADVMDIGMTGTYKSVFSKKAIINGFEVKVIYNKLSNGIIKISDAWVN